VEAGKVIGLSAFAHVVTSRVGALSCAAFVSGWRSAGTCNKWVVGSGCRDSWHIELFEGVGTGRRTGVGIEEMRVK
jgi:hypothetical protein